MAKPTNAELEGDIITGACSPWDKRHNAAMQELIDARERLARLEAVLAEAARVLNLTYSMEAPMSLHVLVCETRDNIYKLLSPSEAGRGST